MLFCEEWVGCIPMNNWQKNYKKRLSKSALQTFKQCPEKFYFTHVLRLEDPSGPEALLGQHIHKSLADFYQTLDFTNIKTPMDLVAEIMKYDTGGCREHYTNFASFNVGRYKKLKNKLLIKPIMMEQKIVHPDLAIDLVGVVDAVFQDDNGNVLVMDYKTGKFDPGRIHEYRMELAVYTELVAKTTSFVPTSWGILFTKSGNFWNEPIIPDYFAKTVVPLVAAAKEAIKGGKFEPTRSPLCMYCTFKNRCSLWGGPKDPVLIEQLKKAKEEAILRNSEQTK